MPLSKSVRAGEFQPHTDDLDAMAQMSGFRCNFKLNPRGQVYHLWFAERLADEHVKLFSAFPNLISVSAGVNWEKFKKFTEDGALALATLPRLCAVDLNGFVNLSNRSAKSFLENKRLRWLLLNCPNIDDRVMDYLPDMEHLVKLGLSHSAVTADSLPKLKQLTNLRFLGLRKCNFSAEEIVELDNALPKCKVAH